MFRIVPDKALAAAALQALKNQPDSIRLVRLTTHEWKEAEHVRGLERELQALGFRDAGIYAVESMPLVTIQFLLHENDRIHATINEHEKAGQWISLICRYEDGSSLSFATTPDRGMKHDPRYTLVHMPGARAEDLYREARAQRSSKPLAALDEAGIVGEYEKAYAEQIRWTKQHGIPLQTAAQMVATRHANELKPLEICFLGEQDGLVEKELKQILADLFDRGAHIARAYLARGSHEDAPKGTVLLCLVPSAYPPDAKIVADITTLFSKLMRQGTFMDILFLTPEQEAAVSTVCPPFYGKCGTLLNAISSRTLH